MKVIRLVEDEQQYRELYNYGVKDLKLTPQLVDEIVKQVKEDKLDAEQYLKYEDALEAQAEDYTNVDVNLIRDAFTSSKNKEALLADNGILNKFLNDVGNYNGNKASNLLTTLKQFDFNFIKYFLDCLGYENLGNRKNLILTALTNDSAPNFISGNKALFTKLFNLVNNDNLNLTAEYLKDREALIYNRDLYMNATNQDVLEDIISADMENVGDPNWRKTVLNNINGGNLGQFRPKNSREDRDEAQATNLWNKMSDSNKANWLVRKGVNKNTANDVINQINSNETNNK